MDNHDHPATSPKAVKLREIRVPMHSRNHEAHFLGL